MNLRFVEAFHWAVSLKSVTRAAEKLHLTQSALSSRIASLEEELGVVLLDRRDKQFRLTMTGQRSHTLALRIGAIESVVDSWLTGWLQQVREDHPDMESALAHVQRTSPARSARARA